MVLRFLMLAAVAAQLPAQTPVHARVRLGFAVDSGRMLVVREMAVPSAASRAGLRVQDTLVAINGRPATWNVLVDVSDRLRVRDTVQLDVRSIGSPRRVILVVDDARLPFVRVRATVLDPVGVIGSLLDSIDVMMSRRGPGDSTAMILSTIQRGTRAVAGAELAELESPLAGYLGVSGGLLVLRVTADGPAAKAGMASGDVITAVDGVSIATIPELRLRLQLKPRATLSISRDRKALQLELRD